VAPRGRQRTVIPNLAEHQTYELVWPVGYDSISAAWPSGLLACGALTL